MSWITAAVCDICGRQKGEANHWAVYSETALHGFVAFRAWDDESAKVYGHLCSEECAHKLLARYLARKLETGTFLDPYTTVVGGTL